MVFTFGWDEPGHPIPAGSTKVAITLIPEGDERLVRLVHSGLPEDAITDHENGWQFFLDRLALIGGLAANSSTPANDRDLAHGGATDERRRRPGR